MWSFVAKGLFKWLPFWAPCCNLAIVLTPLKQIRTCQQTIYSTLHRNFSLSTVLYNVLKSFSHFPVNFFEFKTEIWIWYLWEKSSKGTITWSKLEENKIGDSWNNFFKCEKTFCWYLLLNRRLKVLTCWHQIHIYFPNCTQVHKTQRTALIAIITTYHEVAWRSLWFIFYYSYIVHIWSFIFFSFISCNYFKLVTQVHISRWLPVFLTCETK